MSLCLSTSCVKLFNVNFHVGRQRGRLLIMHFFFFFILLQCSLLPPTHQHSNTLFFPHQSCCVPALCRLHSKQQFISSFIISSIPPTIASTNALPFEREMKGAKRAEFTPSLCSPLPLSPHIRCMLCLVEPGIWKWSHNRWEGVPQAVQMTDE